MVLALLPTLIGLPLLKQQKPLEPEVHVVKNVKALGTRMLATSATLKDALKSTTANRRGKAAAGACECWMWSDPHVESCDHTKSNFNPKKPINILAHGGDDSFEIQSYHCPVVQETCQPDYYPCGATSAVAFAGRFTGASGATHTILFHGEDVYIDGQKVDLGVRGNWTAKAATQDGCTIERKLNRVIDPKSDALDAGKMTGEYETSFSCGGAKVTTWYYDEEHMPTGYLMNALVTVPDADKAGVTGLCHSTSGDDAAPQTCAKGDFYGRWATMGEDGPMTKVDVLGKLAKVCGTKIPDCTPKPFPPPPSKPPPASPPPPPPAPPKLEWGYITDVNSDPEIIDLYDAAVSNQEITFPKGSNAEYCVKKDPDCKHKNLPENIGKKKEDWKVFCEQTCTKCTELVGSCKITEHHDTCEATRTWSDAEADGNQLKEDPDSHLPSGPVQVGFDATVDKAKFTGAEHGCCSTLSCIGWYFQSSEIPAPAGTKFRFQYKASKEADWFEIVAALYEHVGDVKTDAKGVPLPKQGKIVKRKVLRGAAMDDFISDGFETDKAGKYYLAFFAASYDFTAGAQLGSVLTVKSFEYEMPGHHIKKSNMLA